MKTKRIVLSCSERRKLRRSLRKVDDADTRLRYLIVLRADDGMTSAQIASHLDRDPSTVRRVIRRFIDHGEAGLIDRREDNGDRKIDDFFCRMLVYLLRFTPPDFGHRRPTWTHALLITEMRRLTGIKISSRSLGRVLRSLGVRRGRAKPVAPCPWPKAKRERRIREIRDLIEHLPDDEVALWEDEVDIDLNPRIGLDYMLPGTQRLIVTPGKNQKHYLAGALDARSEEVISVEGDRKNSQLFIKLLDRLRRTYPDAKVIHLILDNYTIHNSQQTRAWLHEHGGKFRLHFLPPYCPDDNRIERCVWRELHANVTVNHRCPTMQELLGEVRAWLRTFNRKKKHAA